MSTRMIFELTTTLTECVDGFLHLQPNKRLCQDAEKHLKIMSCYMYKSYIFFFFIMLPATLMLTLLMEGYFDSTMYLSPNATYWFNHWEVFRKTSSVSTNVGCSSQENDAITSLDGVLMFCKSWSDVEGSTIAKSWGIFLSLPDVLEKKKLTQV